LRAVRLAEDVGDREAISGCGGGLWGVVLAVEVLGLHRCESRGMLETQIADARQVVATTIRPQTR